VRFTLWRRKDSVYKKNIPTEVMYLCVLSTASCTEEQSCDRQEMKMGMYQVFLPKDRYSEKISITVCVPLQYPGNPNTNVMPTSHIQVLEATVVNDIIAGHPFFFYLRTRVPRYSARGVGSSLCTCVRMWYISSAMRI